MHDRRFNPEHMSKLDNPQRRAQLPPEKLIVPLNLAEAAHVLDIGAGTGYFTIPAAKASKGTVYALDVEPKMLEIIKEKAEAENLTNIQYLEGVMEKIPMDAGSVDRVIASLVLHEAETLEIGLGEIYRVMQEGGISFCLEWEKKPSEQGPPIHHRIHSDDFAEAAKKIGFTIESLTFPTDAHYLFLLRK